MNILGPEPAVPTDDRGRRIKVRSFIRPYLDHDVPSDEGTLSRLAYTIDGYRDERLRSRSLWELLGVSALCWGMVMLVYRVFGFSTQGTDLLSLVVGTGLLITTIGLFCLEAARLQRRHDRVVGPLRVASYLANGRCPQCGYNIGSIVSETDACVVCPECAAAWRSDRRFLTRAEAVVPFAQIAKHRFRPATERKVETCIKGGVVDQRGVIVPVLSFSGRDLAPEALDQLSAASVRCVRRDSSPIRLRGHQIALAAIACSWALCIVSAYFNVWAKPTNPSQFGRAIMALPPMLVTAVVQITILSTLFVFLLFFRSPASHRARVALRYAVCPTCTSDLRGVPKDGRGLTPCPLCKSVWRLPNGGDTAAITPA